MDRWRAAGQVSTANAHSRPRLARTSRTAMARVRSSGVRARPASTGISLAMVGSCDAVWAVSARAWPRRNSGPRSEFEAPSAGKEDCMKRWEPADGWGVADAVLRLAVWIAAVFLMCYHISVLW